MKTRTAPPIPPPAIVAAAVGCQLLLSRRHSSTRGEKVAAVVVGSAGVGIAVWADVSFYRAHTSVNPLRPEASSSLVTTGANGFTRNPMYVGMLGGIVAHGLWRGGAATMLPAAGAWWWLDKLQIAAEEHVLTEKYGQEYQRYLSRVPRWL